MVTDEQYRALQKRVDELENKLKLLSQQYSTLYMKQDMRKPLVSSCSKSRRRDTTRYEFEDQVYCKRQLVLACIKKYVFDNPKITGEDLSLAFPDYVQGSLGIVRKIEDAEKYSNADRRFYFSDDSVLHLMDDDYVVCAQWDKGNIDRFVSLMNDLGYTINIKTRKY